MPGLAAGHGDASSQLALSTIATDDRLLGLALHHRLLVKPDAFHVTILFQPTLSFLEKSSETLPSDIDAVKRSTTLLDDFILKVYLPQLEEKVSLVFHQAVTGMQI
jgi:exocyst complex component 4